ncbi:MAG: protein kinase [Cyanobacteria bacterium J06554_11]
MVTLAERYEIIEPLAQGGFGKTFLACDRYLPGYPHCVIKQFLPANVAGEALATAKRLFELEAQTLYQLGTHPQIPNLLAHFEQAGEFYLVQEYIAGTALSAELASTPQQQPAKNQYTYDLLKSLLTVLAFVHQRNVIHRDIKPANLIRRQIDSQIVLIDFGAVKAFSESPAAPPTVAIGSPGYIAPEQQAGRPCLASDLYATGMIALYALTGKSPQQLPNHPQTGQPHLDPILPNSALANFIRQLVRPYPSDRFPDATAALATLNTFSAVAHTPIADTAVPTTPPSDTFPATMAPIQAAKLSAAARSLSQTSLPIQSTAYQPSSTKTSNPGTVAISTLSAAETRNRQALLHKVHRFWILGVLEHSLHGQVLLTLGLEERHQALALPWNISYEAETQPIRPLEAGTRVYDIFQQLGEGRSLLILGEPGAGKTTTLLTLARDLLNAALSPSQESTQRYENQRIPAVFNLSSWRGGAIAPWLISELNSKYQIPKAIGKTWVQAQQLLLLLDGLDEVRPDRRDSCAAALNQFHQDYGPELVVCCRIKDYEALSQKLGFQSAVYVRSLTDAQIWQYLDRAETGLTGLKSLLERSVQTTETGPNLLDLARSPLLLNIMALTYQGVSASNIPALSTGGESSPPQTQKTYTHQLFSAYIERMFQRRTDSRSGQPAEPYSHSQTLRWLHSLAAHLTDTSQTVFLIERMQVPNWLTSRRQRWTYAALLWASFVIVATAIGSQVVSHRSLPLAIVLCGAFFVRLFGLYRIEPAEKLRWSWKKASRSLLLGLTVGPLLGISLKVGFMTIFGDRICFLERECLQHSSLLGFSFGAILGLTYGIIRGLSGEKIATVTKPNQGIRQSAKNAIFFALVATIAPAIAGYILRRTNPFFWAAAGLSFGLALGGGEACIKHGILRFILFCQGRIPWNYARFLDYAAERIFLQKVGGGYIFIHRLLLEHFATAEAGHITEHPSVTR